MKLIHKTLLFIFIILFYLLFLPHIVYASDLTITCNGVNCSSDGRSLFNQTNIAPGYSVTKTILIDNSSNIDNCNLHLLVTRRGDKQNPDLGDVIRTLIKNDRYIYFGDESGINTKSLNDLINRDIFLGVVGSNTTEEFNWRADFESSSGNIYQDKSITFDFSINFTCGSVPVDNFNPVSTLRPISRLITSVFSGVEGIQTEVQSINEVLPEGINLKGDLLSQGDVLGTVCENTQNYWWIVLLIQTLLSVILIVIKYIKFHIVKLWLIPILLGVLSQIVHSILGCGCLNGYWCSRYLVLNVGLVIVGLGGYYLLLRFKVRKIK